MGDVVIHWKKLKILKMCWKFCLLEHTKNYGFTIFFFNSRSVSIQRGITSSLHKGRDQTGVAYDYWWLLKICISFTAWKVLFTRLCSYEYIYLALDIRPLMCHSYLKFLNDFNILQFSSIMYDTLSQNTMCFALCWLVVGNRISVWYLKKKSGISSFV